MGRYFGTDGFRGKANDTLTAEQAFKVGRYLGYYFRDSQYPKIVIGKDTRLSSDMLESALAAGIASEGCDAYLTGYCPTPMICYLTVNEDFACGAMISASHNPFYDNGIKGFSKEGIKLADDITDEIEKYLDGEIEIPYMQAEHIGKIIRYDEGLKHYLDWLVKEFPLDLSNRKIALDCANGSASFTAKRTLERLGAQVDAFNDQPDGVNINNQCGSTHPEKFIQYMQEHKGEYDLGLMFDGDADRLIAVSSNGVEMNGDYVLYICGRYYKEQQRLTNNTIVTTVMANLGLWKAMEDNNIHVEKTDVGDKNVYDCMIKNDYIVGGEQSGHIIFKNHETTGDGLVTGLALLKIMAVEHKSMDELGEGLKIYPQLLVNVKVHDKETIMDDPDVQKIVKEVNDELHGNGRLFVRPSGTEPLLRVMAEAETDEICHRVVYQVADLIKERYGIE